MEHICPVCGHRLSRQPWRGRSSSQEICVCCGMQFGYHDAAGDDAAAREHIYRAKRAAWIAAGMPWRHGPAPPNWDPKAQLAALLKGGDSPS